MCCTNGPAVLRSGCDIERRVTKYDQKVEQLEQTDCASKRTSLSKELGLCTGLDIEDMVDGFGLPSATVRADEVKALITVQR